MQSNQTEAEQTVTSAVRSMTGYGRAQQLIGNKEITVEIRSVNFPCSKGIFLSGRQTEESGKSFGFPRQGGCILKHSDRKRN